MCHAPCRARAAAARPPCHRRGHDPVPRRDPSAGCRCPPRLTQALSQLIALADVREPEDLPPLLAPAFPLAATSCSRGGGDDDTGKRGHAGRMSIAAPARPATEGNRETEPLPSPAELSGLGFPPSHHCWSPKPITQAHTRTPPASGLWATLKPRRKTDPQPLRGL